MTAHLLAAATDGLAAEHVPAIRYARGVYFAYAGRAPFRHLIYPVPVPGGLGTHLTLDLSGAARFGPDVEWIDAIDYYRRSGARCAVPGGGAALLAGCRSRADRAGLCRHPPEDRRPRRSRLAIS